MSTIAETSTPKATRNLRITMISSISSWLSWPTAIVDKRVVVSDIESANLHLERVIRVLLRDTALENANINDNHSQMQQIINTLFVATEFRRLLQKEQQSLPVPEEGGE